MPPTNPVPNLSRPVRKKLKRRARRQARREFAPAIAQAQAQVQAVREPYQREMASIEGSNEVLDNALQAQIRQLKHSGLDGRYLRDAIAELSARRSELPASEAFLKSDVRMQRRDAVTQARLDVANLQTDQATAAAQNFNSLLNSAYEDKASRLENQRQARQDRRQNSGSGGSSIPREEARAAAHEVQRLFKLNPEMREAIFSGGSVEREGENGTTVEVGAQQLLAELEELVRKAEGVGYGAAQRAIRRLRKRIVNPAFDPDTIAGPVRPD